MSFTSFQKLLPRIIRRLNLQKAFEAAGVCEKARQALTKTWNEEVSKKVRPLYFKKGILTLGAENSVWAQEIHLQRKKLLEKINHSLPRKQVKEIRIRLFP